MDIKPCKDCLYYDDCIKKCINDFYMYPYLPVKLKTRIYRIFVEGWDCFHRINRDLEY